MSKILYDSILEEKGKVFVCSECGCVFSEEIPSCTHIPELSHLKQPYPVYCPKCWHVINVYI